MNEIICPQCAKAFKIDDASYADIQKQVRDSEFEHALHERLELADRDKRSAVELAEAKVVGESRKQAAIKDAEIQDLKARLDAADVTKKLAVTEAMKAADRERDALAAELGAAKRDQQAAEQLAESRLAGELQRTSAIKDAEIQSLKAKLEGAEVAQKLALAEALNATERERDALAAELAQAKLDQHAATRLAESTLSAELQKAVSAKDSKIQELESRLQAGAVEHKLALNEAVSVVERDRDAVRNSLERTRLESQLAQTSLRDKSDLYSAPYFENWITYIWSTGANWGGPIGKFHLTIDKGDAKNLVSFCWDGKVSKSGPTRFEMSAEDWFPPGHELEILILKHIEPEGNG